MKKRICCKCKLEYGLPEILRHESPKKYMCPKCSREVNPVVMGDRRLDNCTMKMGGKMKRSLADWYDLFSKHAWRGGSYTTMEGIKSLLSTIERVHGIVLVERGEEEKGEEER